LYPGIVSSWYGRGSRSGGLPCSNPCPCTSTPSWTESWMPRRPRCGACVGARADDIACRGMRASIGSPIHVNLSFRFQSPTCTYSSATSHGSQQAVVDLNDLLDRLTCYPISSCCSRVGGDDDAALEAEGKRCGAVGNLDGAVGVGVVVRHCAQP
jgi:hypothetical protein